MYYKGSSIVNKGDLREHSNLRRFNVRNVFVLLSYEYYILLEK